MDRGKLKLLYPSIAEKLSEKDIMEIFVVPPIKFSLDDSEENNIVEGERGTGKTIMLRYVDITKREEFEKKNGNVFPIYIPLSKANLDLMLPYDVLPETKKYQLCLEFFNLYCLIITINSFEKSKKFSKRLSSQIQKQLKKFLELDFPDVNLLKCLQKRMNFLKKGFQRNKEMYPNQIMSQTTTIIDFTEKLNEIMKTEIKFLLLIDDFYKVPLNIQPYIVCIFNQRSPYLSYKIATINKGIHDKCFPTGYFEYIHDYTKYNANRLCSIQVSKSLANIQRYFEEMANKQLTKQITKDNYNIIDILGHSKDIKELVSEYLEKLSQKNIKARKSYYGFENIFTIASGNARVFFNIIREIYKEALSREQTIKFPINESIQNDKINFVSKQSFAAIGSWHRDQSIEEKLQEQIPISKKLSKLIEALADIFKYRLQRPIISNATCLFVFNDESLLSDTSKDIIYEGLRQSCIQEISLRKSKAKKGVGSVYSINGILAPALDIFPLRRWIQSIDIDYFNRIEFNTENENKYIRSLKNFVQRVNKTTDELEDDGKQLKIDQFFGV